MATFRPLCINALYTGIERGLAADLRATNDLDGRAHAVCSSLITASHGHVTDVLPVPTDSVQAQLEHLLDVVPADKQPTAVRVGIISQSATVEAVFQQLERIAKLPTIMDLTLSGPAGEDIIDATGLEAFKGCFERVQIVAMRRHDAELVAGMEIQSLDDAQVAVQRLHSLGARSVLLRCGVLPARHFDETEPETDTDEEAFVADLFYNGEEFHLFEAPQLTAASHGASSFLNLALLHGLQDAVAPVEAMQWAKRYVTDWLREQAGLTSFDYSQMI